MIRKVFSLDAGSEEIKICDKNGAIVLKTATALLKNAYSEITAYGDCAKGLLGKLPPEFSLIKPIREGRLCDFDAMVNLLQLGFFSKKIGKSLFKPHFFINASVNSTLVEREALCEAVLEAGASKVFLVDSPVAATLGAGIDIAQSHGNMIVITGAEHTEIAILSLSNMVFTDSPDFSLSNLKLSVKEYVGEKHEIMLGENTLEEITKEVLMDKSLLDKKIGPVVGIDKKTGFPKKIFLPANEIWDSIRHHLDYLIASLRESMDGMPPELIKDIMERGLVFAGGLANYSGFIDYVKQSMGINIVIPENPEYLCVRGNMVIHRNKKLYPLIQEVF